MSTAYYLVKEGPTHCPHCGTPIAPLLIGQTACRAFHVRKRDEWSVNSLGELKAYLTQLTSHHVRDEYGLDWTVREFLEHIEGWREGDIINYDFR